MKPENIPYGLPELGGTRFRPQPAPGKPSFGAPPVPGEGIKFPFPIPECEFRPQVEVGAEGVSLRSDAERSGDITAESAVGVTMTAGADAGCINGIYVKDRCNYTVKGGKMRFDGDGVNDFAGLGACVESSDCSVVTLEDTDIETNGVIRPCTFAADYSTLIVKNCRLIGNGGVLGPDEPAFPGPGMRQPPAGLELGGNCRTHLSVGDSHSFFYDSYIEADGWAALSTDSCYGNLYLEADNCDIVVKNRGYGTYSDSGARVVLKNCRVDSYLAAILAGKCSILLQDCDIKARKSVAMIHSVMGTTSEIGEMSMIGGKAETDLDCFLVKSQNTYIEIQGAQLHSKTGVLLHSIVSKDLMATKVPAGEAVYGVKAVLSDMDLEGDILHEDPDRSMIVRLKHVSLKGRISGAMLCLDKASTWLATADSDITLVKFGEIGCIDALPGVTITAKGGEDCGLSGTYQLPSGGVLKI